MCAAKANEIEKDEDGWPLVIPEVRSQEFTHGRWGCGSRCCLVGWVGEIFHGNVNAFRDKNGLGDPALQFLNKFCELSGREICMKPPVSYLDRLQNALMASDAFEGSPHNITGHHRHKKPLSPEEAAETWLKTLEYFGYTASTKIDVERPNIGHFNPVNWRSDITDIIEKSR